jgi:hypothetical protein
MDAVSLLEEISDADGKNYRSTIIAGKTVRVYSITGIGAEGLGCPSRVAQREVVIDGRRFLVQVISLSENY